MRTITKQSIHAFLNAEKFNSSNTRVIVEPNVTILSLFGNNIAFQYNDPERTLSITTCGYNTASTRERLNGLPNVWVTTKKEQMFLNGQPWDGELIDVDSNGKVSDPSPRELGNNPDRLASQIKMTATIAGLGSIMGFSTSENNDFRVRMLQAGLPAGAIHMPADWDSLSEEEQDRRLTQAVNALKS